MDFYDDEFDFKVLNVFSNECLKVKLFMYFFDLSVVVSEIMVRVRRFYVECILENLFSFLWLNLFFFVVFSGSIIVLVL